MTREEVLLQATRVESEGKRALIERYADLLAELERMLSDRTMRVLVEAGARLLRLSHPDVFRAFGYAKRRLVRHRALS